jgi:microcompartment protein CcmL/EutN
MERAIATIELISVARGVLAADAMLKAADVRLYEAHPICPGKYLVVVGGQVGAVEESLRAGVRIGREAVSDHMILPNVTRTFSARGDGHGAGKRPRDRLVETMAAPCAIEGADAAAKAANISLLEIRLGRAWVRRRSSASSGTSPTFTRPPRRAKRIIAPKGLLVDVVEITGPHPDLPESSSGEFRWKTGRARTKRSVSYRSTSPENRYARPPHRQPAAGSSREPRR